MIQQKAFCRYPFSRLKITPDGDCTFCCHQRKVIIGNILKTSLEEIWNSPLARDIRKETLENKLHKVCSIQSCPFYWKKELKPVKFLHRNIPIEFELDLPNTHCNIGGTNPTAETACLMCERGAKNFKPDEDRINEICEKIKPFMQTAVGVHIQGISEPFWKDKIFEIIQLAGIEQHRQRITISTTTNGTLLSDKRIDQWLSYPNTCTTFSMDASTPQTYKKIRRLDAYHAVIKALKKIAKKRRGLQKLFIHNNINMVNVYEVIGMVELAAETGVDEINFNPTFNLPGLMVSKNNADLFKKAESEIIETADRLNVNVSFLRSLSLDHETRNLVELKLL